MKKIVIINSDILGTISAVLCLIHCLIFPLITFFSISFSHNHWIDLIFCLLGIYAVVNVLKSKSKLIIKILLSASMMVLLGSVLYNIFANEHTQLLYFSSVAVIIIHLINFFKHEH